MSSFTVLLLCIQACLIHNAYTQCLGPAGFAGYGSGIAPAAAAGAYGYGPGFYGAPVAAEVLPGYGGSGVGDVAVAGEMPVAGTTLVAGQVPILGAVRFAGELPAAGTVTIAGSCGCGCGPSAYVY
ncbi:unnamed protein product [Euphydryas editha]|uniref:Uncharacterized protein n=1 Tax=Euphydryas editha TaxID=104508 RepID=A0AAU9TEQ5_EUPED|nr:unnamed protein product [Euphydryas editha]